MNCYKLIRPLFFRKDPEEIHGKILNAGKYLSNSWLRKPFEFWYKCNDERLRINVYGIDFENPAGLAAGFDKNGELLDFLSCLGFGFVEIGSITAKPCEGNSKPRLFRLPEDRAIINRMGLNNNGADEIYDRLNGREFKIPIGVNIAKTNDPRILGDKAVQDFCYSFEKLYSLGDYLVINISCPNTAEGKTFENKQALDDLLSALKESGIKFHHKKPVLVKVSPDVSYKSLDDILEVSEEHGISGYVISNTSSQRNNLQTASSKISEIGKGGLSGRPIKRKSTEVIGYVFRRLRNPQIIGVGGIFSAEDAYEKIRAGASLVQLFTGLIYEGPGLVKRINKKLVKLLERDGFSSLKEAVGSGIK